MMADVARRKKTEGKRQYGAYSADEHTLSQWPGISLSVVRRTLHHCVIIAHIPYISLEKKKVHWQASYSVFQTLADASIKGGD